MRWSLIYPLTGPDLEVKYVPRCAFFLGVEGKIRRGSHMGAWTTGAASGIGAPPLQLQRAQWASSNLQPQQAPRI